MPQKTTKTPKKVIPPFELECNLCTAIKAWQGPKCEKCNCRGKEHYTEGTGEGPVDFFCVTESPELSGPSGIVDRHEAWNQGMEAMVRSVLEGFRDKYSSYKGLTARYTHAMRCEKEKPTKTQIMNCAELFHPELLRYAHPKKPIVILAFGKHVLTSLGITVRKYQDAQGKFLEARLAGRRVLVFPTLSKRQLLAKSGFMDVLNQHLKPFMKGVLSVKEGKKVEASVPLDQLVENYRFPKTIVEVRALIDEILDYSIDGNNPEEHYIAIDTETNTLFPYRDKLKVLTVVVSWDRGKAASIPVDHSETPWTFEEVFPQIARLLISKKPKIFHNAKYDLQVLKKRGWQIRRVAWDTMLGEHLLAEDKKGYYGLKQLTKTMLPSYAGYDDELTAIREKLDKAKEEKENNGPKIKLRGAAKKLQSDEGFENVPLDTLNKYGAVDGDVTRRLCFIQRRRIEAEQSALTDARREFKNSPRFRHIGEVLNRGKYPLKNLMFTKVVPATRALSDMEFRGMAVDREYVEELSTKMDISKVQLKIELLQMIPGHFPGEFNPNSTKQLRDVLFGLGFNHPETKKVVTYKHKIPEDDLPRTPTGAISTDANMLRRLKNQFDCPFSKQLLDYRAVAKARDTFVENIRVLSKEDGRMHTTFHISGTATGRLSSSGENMQNLPLLIGEHNIKKIFVPGNREDNLLVDADAKAAEVRVYAAYSQDKNLIKALNDGMDPHSFFASSVYDPKNILKGVPSSGKKQVLDVIGIDDEHEWSYDDFADMKRFKDTDPWYANQLKVLRTNIKRVVFGILYGAGKYNIANIVGIPQDQAQAIIDSLFKMFPSISTYVNNTHDQVEHLGIVETFFGRRRRFELKGMSFSLKARAKRQAVNFKIQSTSSDMIIGVLCDIIEPLERDFGGEMLITVHDSLVFEVPKKYASQMPDFMYEYGVKRVAENYPWLPVPFHWDTDIGDSYGETYSVAEYLDKAKRNGSEKEDADHDDHSVIQELKGV